MELDLDAAVWGLIEQAVPLTTFESWVYQADGLEAHVGLDTYLALLQCPYDDPERVLSLFQPWANAAYGNNVDLVTSYRILSLCRRVLDASNGFLGDLRALIRQAVNIPEFADGVALWRDDAWGPLAQIDADADRYPVKNPADASPTFTARMAEFEDEVRDSVRSSCHLLVERYGRRQRPRSSAE